MSNPRVRAWTLGRRRLLGGLAGIVGLIPLRGAISASKSSEPSQIVAVPPGFLRPMYLPPGWTYRTTYRNRTDGFRGADEIALWFSRGDDASSAPRPLCIYQTRTPRKAFGATETHVPQTMQIRHGSGTLTGELHLGIWRESGEAGATRLVWYPDDVVALIFSIRDVTVGIRASRMAGIDPLELSRIAASLA